MSQAESQAVYECKNRVSMLHIADRVTLSIKCKNEESKK
jgi:hypothetical protein